MSPDRFESHRPMLLAGLRRWHSFAEAPQQVPQDWKRFMARLPLTAQIGGTTYGATCDADIAEGRFEYMCAVEVEGFDDLRPDVGRMRVPEANYAVFVHQGPITEIRRTITGAYEWLNTNGEWKDGLTPVFERYGADYDDLSGIGNTEIWLPVIPVTVT